MTSNLFTARKQKQQPPPVCIKGAPDLLTPPILPTTLLLCAAHYDNPNHLGQYADQSELFPITKYPPASDWRGPSHDPAAFFFVQFWLHPSTNLCDFLLSVFMGTIYHRDFHIFDNPVRSLYPLDTGLIVWNLPAFTAHAELRVTQ